VVGAVVVLAVAFRSVSDDSIGFSASETLWESLLELAAVLLDTAVDGSWRRHRNETVAVISGVTVAE
jgi:hypothetical protein